MTLHELREKLKAVTGITSEEPLKSALQMAAVEVWESADLPDTLQEVRVCTGAERFVTMPWQVHKIRGIKSANNRYALQINTVHPYYQDMRYYQSELDCRVVRYVPLRTKITNASTLKFKAQKAVSEDVTFTISGEVDTATYVVEPLVLSSGHREVISTERFVNVPLSITKNIRTETDVDILDASGNILATFPNHLLECKYMLLQMYDRCTSQYSAVSGCFDVLFKPHPPQLDEDTDTFPDPFSQVVVFKAAEQITLRDTDKLDVAAAYNEKALSLLKQFSADAVRGKTLKPNIQMDRLTTRYQGLL